MAKREYAAGYFDWAELAETYEKEGEKYYDKE